MRPRTIAVVTTTRADYSYYRPVLSRLLAADGHGDYRLMPGGVRNRYGIENVRTPFPKWLVMRGTS